jgi:DNA-binding XRE family transcriptional regulator
MMNLFELMDEAMAQALGVEVQTYINVIENKCTVEEATFIVDTIWEENEHLEDAKKLFNSKLESDGK